MSGLVHTAKTAFFNPTYGWKTTHFWGPVANWGIALAGVYDMASKDASVISIPMTGSLAMYSLAFMRFAWRVAPRNYILLSCHIFNEAVQLTQLYRALEYKRRSENINLTQTVAPAIKSACASAVVATGFFIPQLQRKIVSQPWVPNMAKSFLNHPAGPFTIFFWAPLMKWALSIANIMDYRRPVEKVSVPQQVALMLTGVIWTRWSFVITPVNYSLAIVNAALAVTGGYHLTRKLVYDPFADKN
jgi:mitochondrial pyruvate carrier 2